MKGRPIAAASAFIAVGSAAVVFTVACTDIATPRIASKLAFTIQPATAGAGVALNPAIQVAILDKDDRPVSSSTNSIQLALVPNAASATLFGVTRIVAVNGVATFNDVNATRIGAGYRLLATSPGLVSAVSSEFSVTFGPAHHLAFSVQPGITVPASSISPSIVVDVRDSFNNLVTTATNNVTLSISTNGGGGTLSGATTVAAVNGAATFANLSIDNAGDGYTLIATSESLVSVTSASFEIRAPVIYTAISAGYFHSCGRATDGRAYCWGESSAGQLGGVHGILPGLVSGGHIFASVSAGRTHSCGITTAGVSYCWGENVSGQLGTGGSTTPTPTSVTGSFTALTAGYSHSCAITASGVGYCWGSNGAGELGTGTIAPSSLPVAVAGGLSFSSISPGRLFTCGLTTAGAAYCWGDSFNGQLGDGTKAQRTSPVAVSTALKFAAISAGGFHACGLTVGGAAYCWGDNTYGQLGDGTQVARTIPGEVSGGNTFASISAGNRHTCAVTTSGTALCWGDNFTGLLGTGGSSNSSVLPAAVAGGLTFGSVSAGRFHTCGVTTAGAGYCWGDNAAGKLGDGQTVSSRVPVLVR